jgi:hypothetical protein
VVAISCCLIEFSDIGRFGVPHVRHIFFRCGGNLVRTCESACRVGLRKLAGTNLGCQKVGVGHGPDEPESVMVFRRLVGVRPFWFREADLSRPNSPRQARRERRGRKPVTSFVIEAVLPWSPRPKAGIEALPPAGGRHLDMLKWGLLPHWTKEPTRAERPINARSETAAKSGMFRGALSQRRCIVPADAFYKSNRDPPIAEPCRTRSARSTPA